MNWGNLHQEDEQIVGIGKKEGKAADCHYHYTFVCPHCNMEQVIHTDLQSRYGDLGGYRCMNAVCRHEFHCTCEDGGDPQKKLYVYDEGHLIDELQPQKSDLPAEVQQEKAIPEGAYSYKSFHTTCLINDEPIYISIGYFETRKGRVFALAYDYPHDHEDYFEYYRISEAEWRYWKVCPRQERTVPEVEQWRKDNVEGRQILCNDFPEDMSGSKSYFTNEEI